MRSWIEIVEGKLDSMMSLDPWSFDQTVSGWRSLPSNEQITALNAYINTYIRGNSFTDNTPEGRNKIDPEILFWHLGQVYAMNDKLADAIKWMSKSKVPSNKDWNDYVDATIAFLRKDFKAFDKFASIPNSNTETIQRLRQNWGKLYKDAY